MSNVNAYLREHLKEISSKSIFIAPHINEEKLNSAIKSFRYLGNQNNVVAVLDNTKLGSGKQGLFFTGEQIIYRASSDPIAIRYESIVSVEYIETLTGSKDNVDPVVVINRRDNKSILIKDLKDCDYQKLVEVLKTVISSFSEYREEKQLIPIDEMPESLKIAYVKAAISLAFDNDNKVDDKEFAEILMLMSRLSLATESRFQLRNYITSAEQLTPFSSIIEQIDTECQYGHTKSLHISLTKDLINLYFSIGGLSIDEFSFLNKHRSLLNVNDKELELIVLAIKHDHNMLRDDFTDDQIVNSLKELSAKAAAIGVPLTAVYLSGSVVGLSSFA